MATSTYRKAETNWRSVRFVEWGLVAVVILVVSVFYWERLRFVQGQAEGAVIKSVLGELRSALLLDFAGQRRSLQTTNRHVAENNPFKLLDQVPLNYRGEVVAAAAHLQPAGSWMFDPQCVCVGYLPQGIEWLKSGSGDTVAWYRVSTGRGGPLQLAPTEIYVWQDKELK